MPILKDESKKRAVVLWTGGKDSVLALHETVEKGLRVEKLVTFVPEKPEFRAHPLDVMELQSQALSIPHECIRIVEPYMESYIQAIQKLSEEGIDVLVTGDIAEVNEQPNWIRECSKCCNMEVATPLWGRDRKSLLHELFKAKYDVVMSCIKLKSLPSEWLGRSLEEESLPELEAVRTANGLDLCGENGEYHTLVLDAPLFKKSIEIEKTEKVQNQEMAYLKISQPMLKTK